MEDGWARTGTRNQDKEPGPGTRTMNWGDEVLESRPFGILSLDAYLAQTFEQKTTAYSCVVSLVHACLAQMHHDLEPGQGTGARKSRKAGLLDFGFAFAFAFAVAFQLGCSL